MQQQNTENLGQDNVNQQYDGLQQVGSGNQYNQFNENNGDEDNVGDNQGDDDADVDDQDRKPDINDLVANCGGPKYIRLRGLPWSATHKEILDFLKNVNVINGAHGIHLVTSRWDGKNTGEAFVEVQTDEDVEAALQLNKEMMSHRYIEVFTAHAKEAQAVMKKSGGPGQSFVVKLRGLPYAVTEQQVEEFFKGLEIKPDREGILFVMDRRGRATGEAYVQFESQEDTEQALGRNREKIGHRYIEIFRSSSAELKRSFGGNGRPGPYDLRDRGGNRGNFGGSRNNAMRGDNNDWNPGGGNGGGSGAFGVGANNTLGFNNMNNYNNSGNFGNFGNNGGGNFSGNGGGGRGMGFGGNGRFNGSNNGGNFSNDFGDFGNFGNNRGNNNFNSNSPNNFADDSGFGGRGNNGNFGTGGNFGGMGNFGNFGNFGNGGENNIGGSGGGNMGGRGGGNFGPVGGGRNDCEYFLIHMRGLPYSSYENEVLKFFDPIRPANVRINFNKKGVHRGTADVFFDTYEDSQLAMKRHKEQMGYRYIELFFDGKVTPGGNNNNNNFAQRI